MNQRTKDQLIGFLGALSVLGVAFLAWAAVGGHIVLTKPAETLKDSIVMVLP